MVLSDKSLNKQFVKIFNIFEKYSPELCLTLLKLDNINEFHHELWCMPFFKKLYKISEEKNKFIEKTVYCYITHNNSYTDTLIVLNIFTVTKVYIFCKQIRCKINKHFVKPYNFDFEFFMKKILTTKPITLNSIDYKTKNMILQSFIY